MSDCIANANNPAAMYRLVSAGAQLRTFPDEVLQAAYDEAYKLYDEIAAENPGFKKIYDPWKEYADQARTCFRVAELPFDYFIATKIAQ